MPPMDTEAHGMEEVDIDSSIESVPESVEDRENQDDVVREYGNFSDKVPRKRELGCQEVQVPI